MTILSNHRALIVGLVSNRSIAYGVAESFAREGAELAFTYQSDKLEERVRKMAAEFGSELCYQCDVTSDEQIARVFSDLGQHWDGLDTIVHSVAFAPADQLSGDYIDNLTRTGFHIANDISAYSFAAIAKAGLPLLMKREGNLITMTYLGAERAIPNYNVMGIAKAALEANVRYMAASLGPRGIRVNAISAGPIRTLAASGIQDFRKMLSTNEKITPMRRNVSIQNVGDTAAFLASKMADGITGEIIHVDAGYHAIGMTELSTMQ